MSSTRGSRLIEDVWLGCVYACLCTSATVEGLARGRACWAASQIGNRPTPVNGCPQDDPVAEHLAAGAILRNDRAKCGYLDPVVVRFTFRFDPSFRAWLGAAHEDEGSADGAAFLRLVTTSESDRQA
jgi:hypothetical protein